MHVPMSDQGARRRIVIADRARAVLRITDDTTIVHCEGTLLAADVTGRRLLDLIHPDDHPGIVHSTQPGATEHAVVHHRLAGQPGAWFETVLVPDSTGGLTAVMSDVTSELTQGEHLRRAERRVRSIIDALDLPCAEITPDGRVMHANAPWRDITGGAGHVRHALLDAISGDQELQGWTADRAQRLRIRWTTTDAGVSIAIAETDDDRARGGNAPMRPSESTDPVTGLLNRSGLFERWSGFSASTRVAVIVMDLVGFRAVNEQHGSAIGDVVLHAVGQRFRAATRPGDLLARLGGDEFALVCRNVDDPFDLISIAGRLRDALEEDVEFDDPEWGPCLWPIAANVGAVLGDGGTQLGELLRQADDSMRHDRAQRRAELEADLADDDLDGSSRHDGLDATDSRLGEMPIDLDDVTDGPNVASVHSLAERRARPASAPAAPTAALPAAPPPGPELDPA